MGNMNVSVSGQCAGKFWTISILGCLKALADKAIPLEEAEKCVFTPFMAAAVDKAGCAPFVADMILKCSELENILTITPTRYDETLNELIRETEAWLTKQSAASEKWVLSVNDEQSKDAAGSR